MSTIIITNDFNDDDFHSAFQNAVIRYRSTDVSDTKSSEILGLGIPITLYPNADGLFYLNLKKYLPSLLIKKNLIDEFDYDFDETDVDTNVREDLGFLVFRNITLRVDKYGGSAEFRSLNLKIHRGVHNYDRNRSRLEEHTSKNFTDRYYFEGYPFEVGVLLKMTGDVVMTAKDSQGNTSDEITIGAKNVDNDLQSQNQYSYQRIIFSRGDQELKYSPDPMVQPDVILKEGRNIIQFSDPSYLLSLQNRISSDGGNVESMECLTDNYQFLNDEPSPVGVVHKISSCSGHYLKWLTKEGDWFYYLFSDRVQERTSISERESIKKDDENLGQNISTNIRTGKISNRKMTLFAKRVGPQLRALIRDMTESPKVYLYLNEQYERARPEDWLEVKVDQSSFDINRPKSDIWNITLDIELPENYNQTL